MDWEFSERPVAGNGYAVSQSRLIIEGDHTISPFEIFVREVLQNSLDAVWEGQVVRVHFKLRKINNPGQRTNFLNAIGWSALRQRVAAANSVRRKQQLPCEFGAPEELEDGSLRVLEISEFGTIGLVGPEVIMQEEDERRLPGEMPKAYIALVRDDARREKLGLGSGGTYGLGKAVLWAASRIQTVIFFSRLCMPFDNTTHRAAGQARLGPHFLNNRPYLGLGYGGDCSRGWCRPICNSAAKAMATNLGINRRETEAEAGTTIIIPFWEQPSCNEDEGDVSPHVLIARYAARYFWPALVDNRLVVTTESEDGEQSKANEHLFFYQPFIELYQRLKAGQRGPNDAPPEEICFQVPVGPPPHTRPATHTYAKVGMAFANHNEEVREDFIRKVACIRGQGMVVGYSKMTGNTLVRPFVGVVLGGRAAQANDNGTRGDVLLGFSEYVTHTRWDEKSASLRYWPEARPVIRELLKKFRDYFERNSRVEQPETTGCLAAVEEGLKFPGAGQVGPQPLPPTGQPVLKKRLFARAQNRYRFEIIARIEANQPPCAIEVWVEPVLETGNASKEERFKLENINTTPANLQVMHLDNGKTRISIPTFNNDMRVIISGSTVEIPSEVFAVSEGLLKATVSSENTTPEPEPVGEEQND